MSGFIEDEIWALHVAPHKTYSQNVQMPFRISMAALGPTITSQARSSLILRLDDTEYVLCSLTPGSIEQQQLSQTIVAGENITLLTDGENTIHLTGNFLTPLEEQDGFDVNQDYSDDEELDSGEDQYDENDSFIDDEDEDGEELQNGSKGPKIEEITDEDEVDSGMEFDEDDSEIDSEEDSEIDSDEDTDDEEESSDESEEEEEESYSEDETPAQTPTKRSMPTQQPSAKKGKEEMNPPHSPQKQPLTPQKQQQTSAPSKSSPATKSPSATKPQKEEVPQAQQSQNTPQKQQSQAASPKQQSQQQAQGTSKKQQDHKETPQKPSQETPKKQPQSDFRKISGGVEVKDLVSSGSDKKVKKNSKVHVVYKGTLTASGKVFDSNDEKNLFQFQMGKGSVIKGLELGLEGMALNSTRLIKIPAALAYGNKKIPGIPPNSDLTFQVQLKRID